MYINPSEKEERNEFFLSQKFLETSLTLSTHSLLTLAHKKIKKPLTFDRHPHVLLGVPTQLL